jgi:hypothetical protein
MGKTVWVCVRVSTSWSIGTENFRRGVWYGVGGQVPRQAILELSTSGPGDPCGVDYLRPTKIVRRMLEVLQSLMWISKCD